MRWPQWSRNTCGQNRSGSPLEWLISNTIFNNVVFLPRPLSRRNQPNPVLLQHLLRFVHAGRGAADAVQALHQHAVLLSPPLSPHPARRTLLWLRAVTTHSRVVA